MNNEEDSLDIDLIQIVQKAEAIANEAYWQFMRDRKAHSWERPGTVDVGELFDVICDDPDAVVVIAPWN